MAASRRRAACREGGVTRFVDSHAHLADAAFDGDREAVIARARQAGARAIVTIGASVEQGRAALELARAYPDFMAATCGVHPHDAGSFDATSDVESLRELAAAGSAAIGECGLDYHYDNSPRPVQRAAFEAQLALAAELALPVVVHTREAEEDTIDMIAGAATRGVCGVLHCFTGTMRLARAALAAGWFISFSGIVTFRRWDGDDVVRFVPDDRILVESDSPYLAPVPHRGHRNEPALVPLTVARLAAVRGTPPDTLAELITTNAETLFFRP